MTKEAIFIMDRWGGRAGCCKVVNVPGRGAYQNQASANNGGGESRAIVMLSFLISVGYNTIYIASCFDHNWFLLTTFSVYMSHHFEVS